LKLFCTPEHVRVRVVPGLLGREDAVVDHLRDTRVVSRAVEQPAGAELVEAAVAHPAHIAARAHHPGDDARGAHARRAPGVHGIEHRLVGRDERLVEGARRVVGRAGVEHLDEAIAGHLAGHLTGLVAAHAVTDDEQPGAIRLGGDAEGVLVLRALAPDVGTPVDVEREAHSSSPLAGA
jgi:hypothetical protein